MRVNDGSRRLLWIISRWGERHMELHFGSQVQRSDGERLGELTRVIDDSENRTSDCVGAQSARMGERGVKVLGATIQARDGEPGLVSLSCHGVEARADESVRA